LSYFDLVQYFGEVPLHLQPATTFDDTRLPLSDVPTIYNQIIEDASEAATDGRMGNKLSLLGRPVLSSMDLSSVMALHCITLLDIVKNNI
jgi:hypothetical protein